MFWSDLGTAVGYEAIGLVNASLPTVAVFAKYDPSDDINKAEDETKKLDTNEKSTLGTVQAATKDCPPAGTAASPDNYGKGVIFYMQEERIVGILLWNVFNRKRHLRDVKSEMIMCELFYFFFCPQAKLSRVSYKTRELLRNENKRFFFCSFSGF
jgi:apoptosis-inducing factor 1